MEGADDTEQAQETARWAAREGFAMVQLAGMALPCPPIVPIWQWPFLQQEADEQQPPLRPFAAGRQTGGRLVRAKATIKSQPESLRTMLALFYHGRAPSVIQEPLRVGLRQTRAYYGLERVLVAQGSFFSRAACHLHENATALKANAALQPPGRLRRDSRDKERRKH
jgi:hypothetical protein